jgi:C-terminal processing protease CtpA/Prc
MSSGLHDLPTAVPMTRPALPWRATGATLLALMVAACGGGGGGGSDPPQPPASYQLTVSPGTASATGAQGTAITLAVTGTVNRPVTEAVNFGVVVNDEVISPQITVSAASSTVYNITIQTQTNVPAGTYSGTLQLRACTDSAVTCQSPVSGLQASVPYQVTVSPPASYLPSGTFANQCTSVNARKMWVRSYVNEAYLWYADVPNTNAALHPTPEAYFDALLVTTPTASGKPRDQFSFTYDTAAWNAFINSGESASYGMALSIVPGTRIVRVNYVEPGSPAAAQNVTRGDTITAVDNLSVNTASADFLNAALFPSQTGRSHTFTLQPVSGPSRTVALTSAIVTSTPVPRTEVINTASGRVGYILFNDHLASAQNPLIAAIQTLKNEEVTDLILDLRYNGGGFLFIAAQLGYMIGGSPTEGKRFEKLLFNDKRVADNSDPANDTQFLPFAVDNSLNLTTTRLPTLGLKRVFVLTSGDTCSASESVINSLRGVDIEVVQLGGTTCGKPYGFTARDHCGTSYFPIEFQGINAKGFGNYADGFAPTCSVADDLSQPLGSPSEGMLAAALKRRATGQCPVLSVTKSTEAIGSVPNGRLVRSPARENRLLVR